MSERAREAGTHRPRWPGLDAEFREAVLAEGRSGEGRALREALESRFFYAEGKPFLLGPPVLVHGGWRRRLETLVRVYHRAVEKVVRASRTDSGVQEVVRPPPLLEADLAADREPANDRVHICRLDLLLDPAGDVRVLETNANCPGGFIYSGEVSRAWRSHLEGRGLRLPSPLAHEDPDFMARWYLDVAEAETGRRPERVDLLREEGGNRLELGDFAERFQHLGVASEEVDPREIRVSAGGDATVRGRPLTHAYLKLGMQPFLRLRPHLDPFVEAVRTRRLFVQNGQRGRWVGDNKLCLAVMSDPRFAHLFDEEERTVLAAHVPWSRAASLLDPADAAEVARNRGDYVLKRGLDTRGQGVVVGREVDRAAWREAVERARREAWLVQRFHETCWIRRNFDDEALNRHDLALGAINGEIRVALMRSSGELRVNMARTGRLHPVFLGDADAADAEGASPPS